MLIRQIRFWAFLVFLWFCQWPPLCYPFWHKYRNSSVETEIYWHSHKLSWTVKLFCNFYIINPHSRNLTFDSTLPFRLFFEKTNTSKTEVSFHVFPYKLVNVRWVNVISQGWNLECCQFLANDLFSSIWALGNREIKLTHANRELVNQSFLYN